MTRRKKIRQREISGSRNASSLTTLPVRMLDRDCIHYERCLQIAIDKHRFGNPLHVCKSDCPRFVAVETHAVAGMSSPAGLWADD